MSIAPRAINVAALLLGMVLTLCVAGYQFGQSNHTVYLLDALRREDPRILANDWYAAQTTQYHGAFAVLTTVLDRLRLLRAGFLVGYLLLIALLHLAWLRLTLLLGGDRGIYLLSVLLYHLSAAGIGLGMYQFMQDACFIPSNISNVAMLWGIYFIAAQRPMPAATALGLSGLFHLNYALIALAMWPALSLSKGPFFLSRRQIPWQATALLLALCLANILPTATVVLANHHRMPFGEFVNLYVRLRHPHHYDPSSWPIWLWISFLWPAPLAIVAYRRGEKSPPRRLTARVNLFFFAVLLIALLFAGIFYISETLIQMSLFRFSIYPKLLTCLGAAFLLGKFIPRPAIWFAVLALCVGGTIVRVADPPILHVIPEDDADYLAVCDFAREQTPIDAIFLVPPSEQEFRLRAQRAIVINYKGVPQLSGELPEWRDRLEAVLGMDDLMKLPRGFRREVIEEIARRYDQRPTAALLQTAQHYHAAYLLAARELPGLDPHSIVFARGKYRLYDLRSVGR